VSQRASARNPRSIDITKLVVYHDVMDHTEHESVLAVMSFMVTLDAHKLFHRRFELVRPMNLSALAFWLLTTEIPPETWHDSQAMLSWVSTELGLRQGVVLGLNRAICSKGGLPIDHSCARIGAVFI